MTDQINYLRSHDVKDSFILQTTNFLSKYFSFTKRKCVFVILYEVKNVAVKVKAIFFTQLLMGNLLFQNKCGTSSTASVFAGSFATGLCLEIHMIFFFVSLAYTRSKQQTVVYTYSNDHNICV